MKSFALLLAALALIPSTARAGEAENVAALRACSGAIDLFDADMSDCVGVVFRPCLDDPATRNERQMGFCYSDERDAWEKLTREFEAALFQIADDEQRAVFVTNRALWSEYSSRTCLFYWTVIRGSMARLVGGECLAELSAARLGDVRRAHSYLNMGFSGPHS